MNLKGKQVIYSVLKFKHFIDFVLKKYSYFCCKTPSIQNKRLLSVGLAINSALYGMVN